MPDPLHIVLVEPFFGGSHKKWALGFQRHTKHQVEILSLSAHHWKWRMRIGAVELAKQFNEKKLQPDIILATDMLDLAQFMGLIHVQSKPKTILYMHENQITYPWSQTDQDLDKKRDFHYGFINFTSCIAADEVWFNSNYHRTSFLGALPVFLNRFPDYNQHHLLETIKNKSRVIPVGIEPLNNSKNLKNTRPRILWNHRWEFDKNPGSFFNCMDQLQAKNLPFDLVVLGEKGNKHPKIFDSIEKKYRNELIHFGYTENASEYKDIIESCDIIPVTSNQDFFGISVVESILSGVYPLLPQRLAYPEHIPKALHNKFLYRSENELNEKLVELVRNWPKMEVDQNLIQHVKRYEWPNIITAMDDAMESLTVKSDLSN